jgi:hypothetical protein
MFEIGLPSVIDGRSAMPLPLKFWQVQLQAERALRLSLSWTTTCKFSRGRPASRRAYRLQSKSATR